MSFTFWGGVVLSLTHFSFPFSVLINFYPSFDIIFKLYAMLDNRANINACLNSASLGSHTRSIHVFVKIYSCNILNNCINNTDSSRIIALAPGFLGKIKCNYVVYKSLHFIF